MSMKDWASKEIEIACKRENPNWDGKEFDYGCSCYHSALKAYNSLIEDGHSGFSFNMTKNILIRLMNNLPLTAITEEDFIPTNSKLGGSLQCRRMPSLFKDTKDGVVSYYDVNRAYCVNLEDETDTFSCSSVNVVDEFFPITLPYYPSVGMYKVFLRIFSSDGVEYEGIEKIQEPNGNYTEVSDHYYKYQECLEEGYAKCKKVSIPKEEFLKALANKTDK